MDKFARSENDNKMSKCSRQWRLALSQASNAALALAVVAATLALRKGIIPPARRGFNCADKTITFPTKEEFLSTGTLLGTGLLVTLGVIVFVEYFADRPRNSSSKSEIRAHHNKKRSKSSKGESVPLPVRILESVKNTPRWVIVASRSFLLFVFGLCATVFLTEVGKISSGVLRPNFMDLCRPNVTCRGRDADTVFYYNEYVCQGSAEDEDDARKSFPSGHASVVCFVAVFVAVYLQRRSSPAVSAVFLLRPIIQLLVVSLAWVSCCTRISDNVHHWGDVVVGMVLGASAALWVTFCLLPTSGDVTGGSVTTEDTASMKISLKSCNEATSESMAAEPVVVAAANDASREDHDSEQVPNSGV